VVKIIQIHDCPQAKVAFITIAMLFMMAVIPIRKTNRLEHE